MIDAKTLMEQALEVGFTHAGPLDARTIELKPEVREMCAGGNCRQYNKRWSCPPGCGELDALRARLAEYGWGVLVQTVGQLEDEFDAETMMETEAAHKAHLLEFQARLLSDGVPVLAIGAGCCTQCKTCTYPDAPCRFPEKQMASMEAYGMLVTEVCQRNGLPYNYGRNTLAYTSCFLVKDDK